MKKSEARELRKKVKQDKAKQKSKKIIKSLIHVDEQNIPKAKILPDIEKIPRTLVDPHQYDTPKQLRSKESGSRFGFKMTWCARSADINGTWSWQEERSWSDAEWNDAIKPQLDSLETLDWQEIQNMSSDTGHLMHHSHDIDSLCDDAIKRWLDLNLAQFETVFRFRLGNKKRAWGVEIEGHFFLIWYERYHKIYPV